MEQSHVEMMGFAVVAEVQAKHVETFAQQSRRRVSHVGRLDAAFPAMQQQHQAAWNASGNRTVQAEQSDAVAGIDDVFVGRRAGARGRKPPARRIGSELRADCRCGLRSQRGAR
jgi:hypothetical protein